MSAEFARSLQWQDMIADFRRMARQGYGWENLAEHARQHYPQFREEVWPQRRALTWPIVVEHGGKASWKPKTKRPST